MCLLTALSVMTKAAAISVLERPSAISASTSRSRWVSAASGSGPRRSRSWATTSGSRAVPPAATRRSASRNSATSATRSFSRYPTLLVFADSRSAAYRSSTYCDSTRIAMSGHWPRMTSAARMPSSVWVGGIRTSAITTSGRSRSTAAISAVASPAVAATSNPALSSSLVRPATRSTESSPITTRSVTGSTLLGAQRRGRAGASGPARREQRARDRDDERGHRQQRQPGRPEDLGEAGRHAGVRGGRHGAQGGGVEGDGGGRRDDGGHRGGPGHPADHHGEQLAGPHAKRPEDPQVTRPVPGGHQHRVQHSQASRDRDHQRHQAHQASGDLIELFGVRGGRRPRAAVAERAVHRPNVGGGAGPWPQPHVPLI